VSPGARKVTDALREADRRRDAGDWRGAAAAYAAHLERHPGDWAIWVQHGHCVKEAGDPLGALASYRRAEAGLPGDADLPLQIGHALKLAGDLPGARDAYARALAADPLSAEAWREAERLLDLPEAPGAKLLDLSDLLAWWRAHRAPSGIQRVQLGLAGAMLAAEPGARLAVFRADRGDWAGLPRALFHRLGGLARAGADPLDPDWRATVDRAAALLEAAPALLPAQGAWLVNPGSSWWLPGYHAAIRAARARHGLRYAALVHDAGPVVAPEHADPAHAASFARWLAVLATEADLLIAVSEATRRDLEAILARDLAPLPTAPIGVLRPDARPIPPPPAPPHPRVAELMAEPYALFVATIEARKDHLFVLNAWLALLRKHGAALPRLLLVGRRGFGAEPALALLARAPALEGRVVWLDDVDDAALAALTRGALFCLYHSRHEGWGLPVTEALAAGKPVIAPAHSGLVEAGQGLALHVAPGSEPAFREAVEKLAFDGAFRAAAEARIAQGLRLRDWSEIARELATLLAGAPAAAAAVPPPPLGLAHPLGEIAAARPLPAMVWAERLRHAGWESPEPWGCRTRPGRAELRLPLPEDRPATLRVHLALCGGDAPSAVTLRAGRGARRTLEVAPGAGPIAVLEVPHPGPVLEVLIEAEAGIGVVAAMACAPDDVEARLGFLERLRFVWPEVA
jgi:glycosyltransferase involved in cell wall biosynthesis